MATVAPTPWCLVEYGALILGRDGRSIHVVARRYSATEVTTMSYEEWARGRDGSPRGPGARYPIDPGATVNILIPDESEALRLLASVFVGLHILSVTEGQ